MFPPNPVLLRRSDWPRYGFAVGGVIAAVLLRAAFTPGIGPTALPFITFFPVVAVTAWYGRLRPAIVGVALSALAADWFFVEPIHSFSIGSPFGVFALLAFVFAASVIVAAIEAMHRARAQLAGEIEKRQRAQTALAVTLASIGDGVIATDALGCVTLLNPEAQRLTGWTEAEAKGRPLPEVFHICNEQTRRPAENPVEKVLRTGNVVGLANHTVLVAKNGIETPIDDSAAPIRHPDGVVSGVVLVFRDFTIRKNAEQKLRDSEARFAGVINSAMDAVIAVDAGQRIVLFNPAAEQMFGCTTTEAIGSSLDRFVPDKSRAVHRRHVENFGTTGATNRRMGTLGSLSALRANGEEFPIEASISHVEVGGEKLFTVILRDVTERKRAEETLHHARDEMVRVNAGLDEAVRDRTARLEEMIRELQHVSYAMAHDMRAPLRAMGSYAGILLEEAASHGTTTVAQDYCRRIITAAGRLDTLIRDALSYNRTVLEQPPMGPVDLAKLVRSLLDTYPNFHADKADVTIDGRLPIVVGNESLLTQCFSNLLGNAVKFVAPGIRPHVRVRVSEPEPGVARVWIEDNGIGIPQHAQSRLFGMFQKLDNRYEGTGIGLAIVRKVVERMDGKVGVESRPDQGSRFWVDLRTAAVDRVN